MALPNNEIYVQKQTRNTVEDYVFDKPMKLKGGHWLLHIEKGDAWIFCNRGNFTLRANESMHFRPDDGDICIRRLYVKSHVHFRAIPS